MPRTPVPIVQHRRQRRHYRCHCYRNLLRRNVAAVEALHAISNRSLTGAADPYLIALNIYADTNIGAVLELRGLGVSILGTAEDQNAHVSVLPQFDKMPSNSAKRAED